MIHHRFVRRKGSRHGSGVLRGALFSLSVETGLVACWLGSAEQVSCGAALRIPQASRITCSKVYPDKPIPSLLPGSPSVSQTQGMQPKGLND